MYSAAVYDVGPTGPPCQVVCEPATGEDSRAVLVVKQSFRVTLSNEATPSVQTVTVTVDLPKVLEFDDIPLPRKPRKPFMRPALREIQAPWRARWRLTQQRPRDGLR